jgi:hypothetical protein
MMTILGVYLLTEAGKKNTASSGVHD